MTICRLLKNKSLYLGKEKDQLDSKRYWKVFSPTVEAATFAWFILMQKKPAIIFDEILCTIAKRFYSKIPKESNSKDLQFSKG